MNFKNIFNSAIDSHSSGDLDSAEKLYKQLINNNYRKDIALSNLGVIYKVKNKLNEAKQCFINATKLNPRFADAFSNLADLYRLEGLYDKSIIAASKAISLDPNHENAHVNLGASYRSKGYTDKAFKTTRKALYINPNNSTAHINMATIYMDKCLLQDALKSIKQSISVQSSCNAYTLLSTIYFEMGQLDSAKNSVLEALAITPDHAQANYIMGKIERAFGDLEIALKYFKKAICSNSYNMESYFEISRSIYNHSDAENLLDDLSKLNISNLSIERQYLYNFAKSNFLHTIKNFKESSFFLVKANSSKLLAKPSNKELLISKINYLLSLEYSVGSNNFLGEGRIFIVGMPRSGSTLLETILSLRSNTLDLGEKDYLESSISIFTSDDNTKSLYDIYNNKLNLDSPYEYTVDKQLYNFMYVGFIASCMPSAKIIHCCRNPLDNILSTYRACLGQKNSYTSSLLDTAEILIQQELFMKNFKKKYVDQIYTFNYDLLVTNKKIYLNKLFHWLDWSWDDKYLNPQLSKRKITSASDVQSRKPIHNNSLGGWEKYSDMLSQITKILNSSKLFNDDFSLKTY